MGMKYLRLAAVLFGAVGVVNAAPVWVTSNVSDVHVAADGSIAISFTVDSPKCLSTSVPKRHILQVGQNGMTVEAMNKMLAVISAAAVQNKSVSVYFDDGTENCYVNRLFIRHQ